MEEYQFHEGERVIYKDNILIPEKSSIDYEHYLAGLNKIGTVMSGIMSKPCSSNILHIIWDNNNGIENLSYEYELKAYTLYEDFIKSINKLEQKLS